ncbi:DNA polymerase lambda subunit [Sporothrix brasiliensis 5110]|uniref:DNA polymerase n=1 Tax=Sporothrix brasiliensis 5110 TaxID=1398154 RepID=A0A0C2F5T7_9PEZI|nr:DNA polymerase lambda subunit [Sporothrix brasiliensis 5110]KIH94269.1 DNA polymerase lambda subunit [Sporothrix brasiliensis 5110]
MAGKLTFPSIYLLPGRLPTDEFETLQKQIPSLTTDASKADIFLGTLSNKERAQFELRRLGIATIELRKPGKRARSAPTRTPAAAPPAAKRRKLGGRSPVPIVISSSSDDDGVQVVAPPEPILKVVKLSWFTDSVARGEVLPLDDGYMVYEGRRVQPEPTVEPSTFSSPVPRSDDILQRAQADAAAAGGHGSAPFQSPRRTKLDTGAPLPRPSLIRQSTSDMDEMQTLPPIPDFLHTTYSCQRSTPVHCPNDKFVDALKTIRVARQLTGDKIGIRAYSTAIATIAAYPYKLSTPREVSRLRGCGPKTAELFREFQANGGHVREAETDETDARLAVLRLFYNIWGVADTTARAFYNKGWRDLDDVIEYGWAELTRVQQIGVKYYDELQDPLTRVQVEAIADRVLQHATNLQEGFQMVIVGGYRRGKELSGDVDILISHPDEAATHLFIGRLVLSLEQAGLVTHTLTLSTANSERGQEAVSWKGNAPKHNLDSQSGGGGGGGGGGGFDTLDKALVVWQEPMEAEDGEEDAKTDAEPAKKKNTNPHRRVDIIVSPWKTVGCAVLGWSSGTTFQRDLRRYCKYEKGLRFDSSGARSRTDGSVVDLEGYYGGDPAPDMLTAERRVFDALGLEFRPPNERCTG